MRTEMLWMMLQQTTSINDWCSSRGTSNVQNTHAHTHTKENTILQEALVTESIVTISLSVQTLIYNSFQSDIQVQFIDPVNHF